MEIAQQGRTVQPAMNQLPADDQGQPEAGYRHPQAEQHQNAAQHFSQMQPPVTGLRHRRRQGGVHQGFEASEEGHPADRETQAEK